MLKELKQIFENVKGQNIGLFKNDTKNICEEFNCSEPKLLFTATKLEYKGKNKIIKLFDKLNHANCFKINLTDFIGANVQTNEFWIGTDNYTVVLY